MADTPTATPTDEQALAGMAAQGASADASAAADWEAALAGEKSG
jgi:hypothetical protein